VEWRRLPALFPSCAPARIVDGALKISVRSGHDLHGPLWVREATTTRRSPALLHMLVRRLVRLRVFRRRARCRGPRGGWDWGCGSAAQCPTCDTTCATRVPLAHQSLPYLRRLEINSALPPDGAGRLKSLELPKPIEKLFR
jgi:hypothetical protein